MKCSGFSHSCHRDDAERRFQDSGYIDNENYEHNWLTLCPACWEESKEYWRVEWGNSPSVRYAMTIVILMMIGFLLSSLIGLWMESRLLIAIAMAGFVLSLGCAAYWLVKEIRR